MRRPEHNNQETDVPAVEYKERNTPKHNREDANDNHVNRRLLLEESNPYAPITDKPTQPSKYDASRFLSGR